MSTPRSQFARRAAVLLPMLAMLVTALAASATAQQNKAPGSTTVSYSDGGLPKVSANNSFGVSVTPDNQSQVVSPGGSLQFRVTNTGTVATTYSISANCQSQCTVSPLTLFNVAPGASMGQNVTVSLGSYFGTVVLTASGSGVSDTGSIIPSGATYTVSVSPDGIPDYFLDPGQAGTATFTVSNLGNSSATYSLSSSCDAVAVGCSSPPASVPVGPGGFASVPINFTAGAAGSSGYVRLNAGPPSSDGGSVHVVVYSHTASVSPPAGVSVDPGSYSASFGVRNTGNVQTTYNLSSTCGGQITGCSASLGQITVDPGATTPVSVPYTAVNPGDAGSVTLTASYVGNGGVNASAAMSVSVNNTYSVAVLPDNQSQVVSPSGSVTFFVQNLGSIQTSFSLSVNCGCTLSPAGPITVNPGPASGVQVVASLNGYTGTVILTASDAAHGKSDTGSFIVTAATYTVSVSPDGIPDYMLEAGQAGTATFTVSNSGNSAATYSLAGSCDPVATGCSFPTSVGVSPNSSQPVPINFTAGPAGSSGYVYLNASGPSSDGGKVHVVVYSHTASVSPPAAVPVDPGSYNASFGVTNTGNVQTTYNLTSSCGGQITGCSASLGQITVNPNVTTQVSVPYTAVNRGDAGTVKLTASYVGDGTVSGSGTMNVSVKHLYGVAVTPDNQSQIINPGGSLTFRVTNTGTDPQTSFSISANCQPTCTVSPLTLNNVAPGQTAGQNVTVSLGSYYGTVTLTASDQAHGTSDTGSIIPSAPTYTVSVSPDGIPDNWYEAGQAGSANFTVSNSGNTAATYTVNGSCDPVVTGCSSFPTSVGPVGPNGGSAPVTITFTAGAAGSSGYVRLNATSPSSDGGTVRIRVYSHAVSVAKGLTATVYTGPNLTQIIGVTNTGNVPNSYNLTVSCSLPVSGCSAPTSVSNLAVGATQQVTVTYTGASPGTGTVILIARNTVNTAIADSGTVTVTVKPRYTVAVTPDDGAAQADALTTAIVPFLVTYNGTSPSGGNYTFTVTSCAGTAVKGPCTLDLTGVGITAGAPQQVKVSFPTGAPGDTAAIALLAKSVEDQSFSDVGSVRFTVTKYGVSVTPDSLALAPSAYASDTRTFTVTNSGSTQRTFRLQVACAPPAATVCSASRDTATLAASGGSVGVNVSYTAGDPGTTGMVRLVATDTLARSTDAGTLAVTVGTTVANNQVQFKDINPGTTIERSHCLVFSIVSDVADECGALRIVHPLPAVRTLGKARVPTLIYSSDQVQGPTLAVNIILADTTTIPQSVQLTVVRTWPDSHRDTLTRSYPGTDWQGNNRRRRVALPNVANGAIGILRYKVSVSLVYAGVSKLAAPIDSSELAFVDRSSSAFGGGWWLAGLEQLFPGQYDGSVLWVAGDGSTRKYVSQHTTVGTPGDTVYLAAAFDRPDTLFHRSDGKYQREAGNGLFVEFSGLGLHQRTVNRLGYATVFTYDASNHLSNLQIPPWQGSTPAFTYIFTFNKKSALLDAVTAPSMSGKLRKVSLTRSGAAVQTITEQLGDSTYQVVLQPGAGLLYSWRKDRRAVQTNFAYEASSPTIASIATPTGIGTDSVRHTFRSAAAIGAAGGSTQLDSVYFRYDGPRPLPDTDVTKFWLDRFGGPVRMVDAMSHETRIARGDPRFPGVATEMRGPAPKYFTTWASYDNRGNLRASTQVSPHGDGIDATTNYLWHPKWDMDTLIVQPEGEITHIGYDASGNRAYQEDGRGSMSRVNFQYYATTNLATGAMAGLLSKVIIPPAGNLISGTSLVRYDRLGNVDTSSTAGGAKTAATNDSLGRTIKTTSLIYTDSAHVTETRTAYDFADRVTVTTMLASVTNDSVSRQVTVSNFYNREGQLDSLWREQTPDRSVIIAPTVFPGIGRLVSAWRYDNLGRKIAEVAPDATPNNRADNPVDSTTYDLAGNVTSVTTRRHNPISDSAYAIRMTYDLLGRLKTRTVPDAVYRGRLEGIPKSDATSRPPYPRYPNNSYPALNQVGCPFTSCGGYTVAGDVASFDYDEAGNMTVADNSDARVRKDYYANGQLHFETLYTRTLKRDAEHTYVIEYLYDRDGRLVTLKHPQQLSAGDLPKYQSGYQTGMRYDPVTGALSQVISPRDSLTSFAYDARGQLSTITMPRSFTESYTYDQDGDITRQLTVGVSDSTHHIHDATLTYDLRGKMTKLMNAAGAKDTTNITYNGLGQVGYQQQITHTQGAVFLTDAVRYLSKEFFVYDAMGNRNNVDSRPSTNLGGGGTNYSTSTQRTAYEAGTGRRLVGLTSDVSASIRDTTEYDEAGNIVFTTQIRPVDSLNRLNDRASYYGADGQLRAVDFRKYTDALGVFEEYRYDALGRRVLVEARRECPNYAKYTVECSTSFVRRTVWAGSQELYEIQMPDDSVTLVSGAPLRENDTAAVPQWARNFGFFFDPNQYFGRVAYTYGLKTDQPLTITRMAFADTAGAWPGPFTIVPLWTMRGYADTAFFAETGYTMCTFTPPNTPTRCARVAYAAEYWMPVWRFAPASTAFHGTLLVDKADASGQLFRRNRYYDPASGRFTQEDPIGLAGGLNAYGFANGDPVNFSDPFGLFDITVQGAQSQAVVDYLRRNSETFRKAYDALDADHSVHLTIRDAVGDEKHLYPSQFAAGSGGTGLILFNDVDVNQRNFDLPKGSKFIFTAASAMGHEMGHAAGHWSSRTGVPRSCAGDPPPGGIGCIIRYENKIRSELPAGAQGGMRDRY